MNISFNKTTKVVGIRKYEGEYLFIKNGIDVTVKENRRSKTYKFTLDNDIDLDTIAFIFKIDTNCFSALSDLPHGTLYSITYNSNKSELFKRQEVNKADAVLKVDKLVNGCSGYNIKGLNCTCYI